MCNNCNCNCYYLKQLPCDFEKFENIIANNGDTYGDICCHNINVNKYIKSYRN